MLAVSRYKKVPPDKAMVVFGRGGFRVFTASGKLIWPVFESYEMLPLDVRTLDIKLNRVITDTTTGGTRVDIWVVAQVKISSQDEVLKTSAENLLHKSDEEINEIAHSTLSGHIRGMCATLTPAEINSERDKVASYIMRMASVDLQNMGLEIRSLVIKELDWDVEKDRDFRVQLKGILDQALTDSEEDLGVKQKILAAAGGMDPHEPIEGIPKGDGHNV